MPNPATKTEAKPPLIITAGAHFDINSWAVTKYNSPALFLWNNYSEYIKQQGEQKKGVYLPLFGVFGFLVFHQSYAHVCTVLQLELSAPAFFQAQDWSLYVVF